MTITFDTEFSTETMAAVALGGTDTYYDDPDTYTVAEAWACSPDGEIDDVTAVVHIADERDPTASRAKLFAALAAGVIGGATLGAVLFGYKAVAPPTVVVPGFGVSTSQLAETAATPSKPGAPQKPAGLPAPALKPVQPAIASDPVAAESKTNEEVAGAPDAPSGPGAPPVSGSPVIINIPIPPLGDKPEPPAPEPPNIDVVQVLEDPNQEPPNVDVFAVPTLDQGLQNPTVNGLKPVERGNGSRWTTKLPNNPPDSKKKPITSGRTNLASP